MSSTEVRTLIGSEIWFEVKPKDLKTIKVICENKPNSLWSDSRTKRLGPVSLSPEWKELFHLQAKFTNSEVLHCLEKGIKEVEDTEPYLVYSMNKLFDRKGSYTKEIRGKMVKQNIWIEPGTVRFYSRDLIAVCDGINWYKLDPAE